MKKTLSVILLFALINLCACSNNGNSSNDIGKKWEKTRELYQTVVTYTGEYDGFESELEISIRSQQFLSLLEDEKQAFIMDAYNYWPVFNEDDEQVHVYDMNSFDSIPIEISPNGYSICVNENYFIFNPIELEDEGSLESKLVYDENTINLIVPEQYKDKEKQIVESYKENFYFQKVTIDNMFKEETNSDERNETSIDKLAVNIVYAKQGQTYFTYDRTICPETNNLITDPIVQIYDADNVHSSTAHSYLSSCVFFESAAMNAQDAYEEIRDLIVQCDAEASFTKVYSVFDENTQ